LHPILANPRWLSLYVLGWVPVGVVLAAGLGRDVGWVTAAMFVLPLTLVHSFFGLSSWYVCRAFPITGGLATWRAALTHLAAATMTSAVWVAIAGPWASGLDSFFGGSGATQLFLEQRPMLALVGGLLFLVAAALHYLLMAFEDMQTAERQAIELQLLARDAELKALRTQIDPHFLFNSLHSVSALTSSDPSTARRMCILLADFLRDTLRLGASTAISLADELSLVERYLNIQRVRLGPRLEVTVDAEAGATACRVPPLLLQPVIENAIVHGVTHLIEGGAVRISAVRHEKMLRVSVTNPCDAERPKSTGTGLGLELLKSRLHAEFGSEARAHAVETPGQFEVTIEMPAVTDEVDRTR
jgi:signal transduction histidine kinase